MGDVIVELVNERDTLLDERDALRKRVTWLESSERAGMKTIKDLARARDEARRDALIEAAEFVDSLCIGTVHSGSAQVIAKMLRGKAEGEPK